MNRLILVALFAVACLESGVAVADATLEYAPEGAVAASSTLRIGQGKMRVDDTRGQGSAVIIDPAAKTLTLLDNAKRSYSVLDAETMRVMGERLAQARTQMQQALATMPPEQRARMQQMLDSMPGPDATGPVYARTGQKQKIAGYGCENVNVSFGKGRSGALCVAEYDTLDLGKAERKTLEAVAKFSHELGEAALKSGAGAQLDYAALDGLPVRSKMGDGPADVLLKKSGGKLEAAIFAVPAGYARREVMPGVPGASP